MAANPFDQFDEPSKPAQSANPFDQFDVPVGSASENGGRGAPSSAISRFATGLADPLYGLAQMTDRIDIPIASAAAKKVRSALGVPSMDDVLRQREAEYKAPEGFDVARIAGNVANPVNLISPGAGTARAATAGAVQSMLAPVSPDADFAVEKGKQAALGAGVGTVLSKTMRGATATKEAKELMEQGIQPSFGQSKGGLANSIEQKLSSAPFIGDAITMARHRPLKEVEARAVERVTYGRAKTLEEANDVAAKAYEEVVPHLKPTKEAVLGIQGAMRDALQNPELIDQHKQMLVGIINKHANNFGALDGPGIKSLDSELGALARKYAAGDPASKTLADEIWNVQQAFREGLEAGLPANLQGKLQEANTMWRNLIPLNKASSQRADERIMPRALQKAIARHQRTDVSRMPHDPLIDNAVKVLPSTVPDSGTTGRMLMNVLGASGAGASGALPALMVAGGAAGVGATRPVQSAIVGNTKWQKALAPFDAASAAILAGALRTPSGGAGGER